jgi:hypothetical protein
LAGQLVEEIQINELSIELSNEQINEKTNDFPNDDTINVQVICENNGSINMYLIKNNINSSHVENEFKNKIGINLLQLKNTNKSLDDRQKNYASHLALIKYAAIKKLPYIIVLEDDIEFKEGHIDEKLIQYIVDNVNKYEIFNGNPTFWDIKFAKHGNIKRFKIDNDFSLVSNCQSTTFMVYTDRIYEKIITDFDINNTTLYLDQYLATNFLQCCYSSNICYATKICSMKNNYVSELTKYIAMNEHIIQKSFNNNIVGVILKSDILDTCDNKISKINVNRWLPFIDKKYFVIVDKKIQYINNNKNIECIYVEDIETVNYNELIKTSIFGDIDYIYIIDGSTFINFIPINKNQYNKMNN